MNKKVARRHRRTKHTGFIFGSDGADMLDMNIGLSPDFILFVVLFILY